MDLRATTPQLDLSNAQWPIYNYHFSLPPAKFVHNEDVDIHGLTRIGKAINSIVCDGCIVSGSTVTDSILFNKVFVHSYATVHNCILLSDVDIGEHCRIRNAIIDKHNMIPRGTIIGYDRAEDEKRYFVVDLGVDEFGKPKWLTVIPKERHSLQVVHPSADLSQLDAEPETADKAPGADKA
jgi:glucose-1-phosphate adenylyltransferase